MASTTKHLILLVTLTLSLSLFFGSLAAEARHDGKSSTMTYDVIRAQWYEQIFLPQGLGPESLAFDCLGEGPYVGISDGRVLKLDPDHDWIEFAFTSPNRYNMKKPCDGSTDPNMEPICGRPLGLQFNKETCELYIADGYNGLYKVGWEGGQAQLLANSADGIPFQLTNSMDVHPDTGVVYFTDSSKIFQRRNHTQILVKQDRSGRFMKYDPNTNNVTVLHDGLFFPNGVALSKDKSFIILVLTYDRQLAKYWLSGPKAGTMELFAQVWTYPDNVKRNEDGDFWVAFNSGRSGHRPRLPVSGYGTSEEDDVPLLAHDIVGAKFSENGSLVTVVDGEYETVLDTLSEVLEHKGNLWFGSVVKPYVVKLPIS